MPSPCPIRHDGTVLAFDFGAKRIGVAVGERPLAQAHPLTVIHAQAATNAFGAIGALIAEWQPGAARRRDARTHGRHERDTPHTMAARCRRSGNQLHGRFGLLVDYADER